MAALQLSAATLGGSPLESSRVTSEAKQQIYAGPAHCAGRGSAPGVGAAVVVGRTWRFEVIAEEGVTPLSTAERRGARDLLLLAPVRAALHGLLPPHRARPFSSAAASTAS